jgi:hypothetical protein
MRYQSSAALRRALEDRLGASSRETHVALARLRRRVVFERLVARLERTEPGRWVVKGGMAMEVRLHDDARLTREIDLGLRDAVADAEELHERIVDALMIDLDADGFRFTAAEPMRLAVDSAGTPTWRIKVGVHLAGKPFDSVQLDISPRQPELDVADRIELPNLLAFAGVPAPVVEVVDVHRHAAEKFHAMLRDHGDRENRRTRDLLDVVVMIEHGLLDAATLAYRVIEVFAERDGVRPPAALPSLPEGWAVRYDGLVVESETSRRTYAEAVECPGR